MQKILIIAGISLLIVFGAIALGKLLAKRMKQWGEYERERALENERVYYNLRGDA